MRCLYVDDRTLQGTGHRIICSRLILTLLAGPRDIIIVRHLQTDNRPVYVWGGDH